MSQFLTRILVDAALGFDYNYPYKSEQEEADFNKMPEIDREEILDARQKKIEEQTELELARL